MERYLSETKLLDFSAPAIANLVKRRGWPDMAEFDRIGAAYDFVRDEIKFGYNRSDDILASEVLADGYGQCNTKGTLLMAMLRRLGIPCRLHGFAIHKQLQRGVVPELVYPLAPDNILHSWVEIRHQDRWINLEGFILDRDFLSAIQQRFNNEVSEFCGYGVGTMCLSDPPVDWRGTDTYIQRTGINADFGLFDSPDAFYAKHHQNIVGLKALLYKYLIRHWMNARVRRIRSGHVSGSTVAPRIHRHAEGNRS
ncbi:transglutaminase-like domain-containing protein [Paracoccus albus]|uniref:transglutaminase-like domain-containing protein n=1 Tax=Paracoccus albus TaxID=3017784 RepID=UPI0022F05240|nr:transglutaminase family protein [Paracoccus albus]WBU59349.1 transglutaminase family protein [Paracoccus albus]